MKDKSDVAQHSAAPRAVGHESSRALTRLFLWVRDAATGGFARSAKPAARAAEPVTNGRVPELQSLAGVCWRDSSHASVALARSRLRRDTRGIDVARANLELTAAKARDALAELKVLRAANLVALATAQPIEALLRHVVACWEPHPIEVMEPAGIGPYVRPSSSSITRPSPSTDLEPCTRPIDKRAPK